MSLAALDNSSVIDETLAGVTSSTLAGGAVPGAHSLRDLQRAQLLAVYEETGGNISETARRLGVCRNTVYRALGTARD